MKKIFLIFTLFVSSYVFNNEERNFLDYPELMGNKFTGWPTYEVCSNYELVKVIVCVNKYVRYNYSPRSGVHAVSTPKGTLFFQSVVQGY